MQRGVLGVESFGKGDSNLERVWVILVYAGNRGNLSGHESKIGGVVKLSW